MIFHVSLWFAPDEAVLKQLKKFAQDAFGHQHFFNPYSTTTVAKYSPRLQEKRNRASWTLLINIYS